MIIIASLAEKGGVGKSTMAVLVATAAKMAGKRVLVVVCDIQTGAAGVLAPNAPSGGTSQFLLGHSPTPTVGYKGIHVLGGGSELDSTEIRDLRHDDLRFNLSALSKDYDFVVLDCAPVIRHLHRLVLDAADVALVIADQSREGLMGLSRVLTEIQKSKDRGTHAPSTTVVVANRASRSKHDKVVSEKIIETAAKFKAASVIIPSTTAIPSALDTRHPDEAFEKNPAADALAQLVTLCGIK